MSVGALGDELVTDLLRSAWIVERARSDVYGRWSAHDDRFRASAERGRERADLIGRALSDRGHSPDADLVGAHAAWIRSLVGDAEPDVEFADIFLVRLGDWVDGHAAMFLTGEGDRVEELGHQERADLVLPDEMPMAPPFEPLETPAVAPPGDVRVRFGILADLHIGSPYAEAMARAAIADLNASGAEFVVQLGDITDHGDADEFERAAEVLAGLEMPHSTMMGNHDVFSVKEERLSGREYYPVYFGRDPDGVLLEHKGIRFAVLDSIEMGASPFSPFDLVTGQFVEGPAGAIVRGSLTPPQHDLLAEVAAPGSPPAFVFLHHPPQPFTAFPPVLFGLRDADSGRLHATCDSGNVWAVFAGHTHRNARTRTFGPVVAQEVATPRDFPFGYALVDVADDGFAYRFMQISDDDLLHEAYERAGRMFRRYAAGSAEERAFVWRRPA